MRKTIEIIAGLLLGVIILGGLGGEAFGAECEPPENTFIGRTPEAFVIQGIDQNFDVIGDSVDGQYRYISMLQLDVAGNPTVAGGTFLYDPDMEFWGQVFGSLTMREPQNNPSQFVDSATALIKRENPNCQPLKIGENAAVYMFSDGFSAGLVRWQTTNSVNVSSYVYGIHREVLNFIREANQNEVR